MVFSHPGIINVVRRECERECVCVCDVLFGPID